MADGAPFGVLVGDNTGTVVYGNVSAVEHLVGPGRPVLGRAVSELVDGSHYTARAHPLADGCTAWYLDEPAVPPQGDLEYALCVADTLAGSLDLAQALGQVVTLAVPALGPWAAVSLVGDGPLRHVSLLKGGGPVDRTVGRRHVGPGTYAVIEAAARNTEEHPSGPILDDGTWLAALGATPEQADMLLADGPVCLWTVALRSGGLLVGILAVAMATASVNEPTTLAGLAHRAGAAIATAQAFEEGAALARALRTSLAPPPMPVTGGLLFGAAHRAAQEASEMGGDFYDVRPEPGGWSLTIGDVCGKGIEAAVLTGQVRQALLTASLVDTDPVARLRLLNQAMFEGGGRSYVTLVHAMVTPGPQGGAEVKVACGGHPVPFLRRRDGNVTEVVARGTLIGMLSEVRFQPASVALQPGDVIVFTTDGLSDARGPGGHLGMAALARCLADCEGMSPQSIADRLLQLSLEHLDGRAHDDMAVLAVQAVQTGTP